MNPDTENQENLVRWGYLLQWLALVLPPTIAFSAIYLLLIRGHVVHNELRSHVRWQLITCGLVAVMFPIALLLLVIGMSGWNTDSPFSILATFALLGFGALYLPWLFFRLLRGTIRFSRQVPMTSTWL